VKKPAIERRKIGAHSAGRAQLYDREKVMDHICSQLALGRSLLNICDNDEGMPDHLTVRGWVRDDNPAGTRQRYLSAREVGFASIAEDIIDMSDKTHEWVMVQKTDASGNLMYDGNMPILERRLMPLSADVVAHKRLQVDTRKWYLSKVLPKIYGEKTILTGEDGGAIKIETTHLKALSDAELAQMQALLMKAAGKKG